MTPHERAYRRLLLLLPREHRAVWGEDMVATYLDRLDAQLPEGATDEDRELLDVARPGWRDAADVAALAARLRLGLPGAPARVAAWGDAVRTLALAGLLVQASLALADVVSLAVSLPVLLDADYPRRALAEPLVLGLAWVAAYVCLVIGRYRWAQGLAGTAYVVALVPVLVQLPRHGPPLGWLVPDVAVGFAVLALFAFARGVPAPGRSWLRALPASGAAAVALLWSSRYAPEVALRELPGLWCVTAVLAAPIAVRSAWRRGPGGQATLLALATGAALAAALRLLTGPGSPLGYVYPPATAVAAVQAVAALLVVGLAVTLLRRTAAPHPGDHEGYWPATASGPS